MDYGAWRLRDFAIIALVPLFFAANMTIGRSVVTEVGPWTLAFLRWTVAFLLVFPVAAPSILRDARILLAQGWLVPLLAFLGMFVCGGGVYVGLHHTTATNATLIYAGANVLILILEWAFRGRSVGLRELLGTVLAIAGVAVVALRGDIADFVLNPGDMLMALAATSWAIYAVLLKRPGLTAIPGLSLFAGTMLAACVLLAPMMLWELASGPAMPQTAGAWLAVAGVALIPSLGAFFGYQYGVRRFGPATMAASSYLWTPYGVILALIFLGETLHSYHLVGLALILPGVVLATARRQPRPAPSAA
jgi:drug/metabolite transporter (DMT)-like permease